MKHKREPIDPTCPDIDKVIKAITLIERMCHTEDCDEIDYYKDIISDIEHEAWGLVGHLEDLRESNDVLRAWGNEEANRVDKLHFESIKNELS